MNKIASVICSVALVATMAVSMPGEARANDVGLGIAAGILGGVIVGSAIASQPRVYVEERPATVYEEDVVVCRKVLYENNYGERYWKRVCHRR